MVRIFLLVIAAAVVLCGCKTIEGGYEENKDKQNAKTEKLLKEDE